jgi:hypothetical protein
LVIVELSIDALAMAYNQQNHFISLYLVKDSIVSNSQRVDSFKFTV